MRKPKRKKEILDATQKISGIDNDIFVREDFDGKKFSDLSEIEVENLVAYIMRN